MTGRTQIKEEIEKSDNKSKEVAISETTMTTSSDRAKSSDNNNNNHNKTTNGRMYDDIERQVLFLNSI